MGVSTMDKERKRNGTQGMKFSKLEQDLLHLPQIHWYQLKFDKNISKI